MAQWLLGTRKLPHVVHLSLVHPQQAWGSNPNMDIRLFPNCVPVTTGCSALTYWPCIMPTQGVCCSPYNKGVRLAPHCNLVCKCTFRHTYVPSSIHLRRVCASASSATAPQSSQPRRIPAPLLRCQRLPHNTCTCLCAPHAYFWDYQAISIRNRAIYFEALMDSCTHCLYLLCLQLRQEIVAAIA